MQMIVPRQGIGLKIGSELLEIQAGVEDYVCPVCLGSLSPAQSEFDCNKCDLSFPVMDGIPVFAKSTTSDCGTMAYSELERLAHHCQAHGWRNGIASFLAEKEPGTAEFWARYFVPEARAAARLLVSANRHGKVLDLGCGIGPLSINFSRYVDEVVAMDCGLTQLQLVRLRAEEAGLRNVRLVCAGDRQHLPFSSSSFEIVLLNGVLEWVGTKLEGDPRQQQQEFLAEVRRVLKPHGEVYIGIENRFALAHLAGMADEHTHLRLVTLLPRRLADVLSRIRLGRPYRIYTHSRRGYRKLLQEAGFAASRFYVPRPNYRNICSIIDGRSGLASIGEVPAEPLLGVVKRRLKALAYPYLGHSFSIVAGKTLVGQNLVEGFVAKLEDWLTTQLSAPSKLRPAGIRIGETAVALVAVADGEKKSPAMFTIRVPLTPQAACQQHHNFEMLKKLAAALTADSIKRLLPTPVVCLEFDGQHAFVHHLCPGFDLRHYRRSDARKKVFRLGLDFLLGLNGTAQSSAHSPTGVDRWVRQRADILCATIPVVKQNQLRGLVESETASLRDERLPAVWVHGDFWSGNLLSTGQGDHLSGVVDWEFSDSESMPLIDLLHLLLYTRALAVGKGFGQLLAERFLAGRFESDETSLIKEYCEKSNVPNKAIWPLAFMAWLDWVYRRTDVHGYLPSWQMSEIDGFLGAVSELPTAAV